MTAITVIAKLETPCTCFIMRFITQHNTAASVELWVEESSEILGRDMRFDNTTLGPKQRDWTGRDDRCCDPRI
jgi:hypothetical protein